MASRSLPSGPTGPGPSARRGRRRPAYRPSYAASRTSRPARTGTWRSRSRPRPHPGRPPVRRALISVFDKTGLEDLVRGLHEAGVELVSTGGRPPSSRARPAGDQGRGAHRLPRVPRGPGQDPAPAGARRHPRRHPQARPPRPARRARCRAPSTSSSSTSTRSPRRWPRAPRLTRSSRTSTSAAPRWCAPPPRTTRASPWSPTRRPTVTCWMPCAAAGSPSPSASAWRPRAFVHTATYDVAVASWMGNAYTTPRTGPASRPGPARPGTRRAVLRYGENPHQRPPSTPTVSSPSPARAGRAAARQGDVVQQLHRRRRRGPSRLRPWRPADGAVIKHANPCGIAVGTDIAEAHRKAHECDPVSAFGGIIAVNRPVTVEMAERSRTSSPRSSSRPRVRRRRPRGPHGEEEHPPPPVPRPPAAVASRRAPSPVGCSCSSATASTPWSATTTTRSRRRRRRAAGAWSPATRPTTRPWPTSSSPGGRCAR
jgi:hypothetical protein